MHRIDTSTKSADLFGAGKDGFKNGNKSSGVAATQLDADYLNDIQENIAGVIEGVGITLVKNDYTQLRAAITKMIQAGQRAVVIDNATFNAGVANSNAVYWDSANSRFDKALADGSVKQNCVGFADVTNSKVYAFGDAVLFSGLTAGARYYLDPTTAGAITSTAPTNAVFVGIAKSASEVFIDIDAQPNGQTKQLQSITATVASNALTLGLNPTSLDFRATPVTNGVPNTRAVSSALSLIVPSGATLGTTSGQVARLALIAIDNTGTVELAVANLAGGVNLDETTLISTVAISAAATSASAIYSTMARVNVPFRVVGFIDITEATAGAWATAPTLIQGQGGQALAALPTLGFGQIYQDVSASRVLGTTYYNTTGKPIFVSVTGTNGGGNPSGLTATVAGVVIQAPYFYGGASNQVNPLCTFIVPAGQSYSVAVLGTAAISKWLELR